MEKNKISKIISIICATVMVISSMEAFDSVFAAENNTNFDLQGIVDASGIKVTNSTTAETLLEDLKKIPSDGYEVSGITDFYKLSAIEGAVENGSAYEGAIDGEVLVPGEKGYVSAVVAVSDGSTEFNTSVILVIEPTMAEYSFASCSNTMDDWAWDATNQRYNYKPASGTAAEKIVIPDEITELKIDWNQYWSYSVADTVKCVVFNENIETIPGVTGPSCWNALEVVSFKGNNLKILDSYTSSGGTTNGAFHNAKLLKHIHLPESLLSLGSFTFYHCQSLTQLYLPDGLQTIGASIFLNPDKDGYATSPESHGHYITELTVPASVRSLGRTAFAGALNGITATVLTSTSDIVNSAFTLWWEQEKFNQFVTLRVKEGNVLENPYYSPDDTSHPNRFADVKLLEDDMGIAEVFARARQKADKDINGTKFVSNSAVLDQITASYGNVSSISASLKNSEWAADGENITNTVVFTKNGVSAELPLVMKAVPKFDLQSIVDTNKVEATNATTKDTLLVSLQEISLPDGYSVEAVTDFYKIKAIDGAIEKGSTYEGAVDGEVLVPGEKGYISAVVIVSNGSNEYDSVITLVIEPEMEEYSFASCSSDEDFVYNSQSWADRWEYTPKSGKAAEKIIIPDKVTELKSDWNQYWNYGVTDTVRCVVFNENIEEIPGVTGNSWNELEVVAFKGNNLKKLASYTSSGGTTYGAFYNAAKLKHIRLPDSIKSIGDYTFYKCRSLTQLYLPEGLETIGEKVFFDGNADWSGQGHNLSEITVPASVTSIGRTAFAGALSDFTATVLTSSENVDEYAFVVWYGGDYNARTTLRALSGTSAANPTTTADNGSSHPLKGLELLEDEMTVAEAAARAKQRADKINGSYFISSDEVKTKLQASYGNVSTISGSWKNEEWNFENGMAVNTYIVAKYGVTAEIEISMVKPEQVEIDSLVSDISVNNLTTADSLASAIAEAVDGEYINVTVEDFYKVNAIEGAVDATDGKNEVMVKGHKGHISAVVYMNNASGSAIYDIVSFEIEPAMNSFTYSSVSSDSDFTIIDGQLVYYEGNAEKIVVPEGVETISANAFADCKATIKAVILPDSLTEVSAALTQCYNMEVVAMGDNVTTMSSYTFDYCHALKHVQLSESLTAIPNEAFRFTYNLFDLYIPDGITSVGNNAFLRSFVKEITLSNNVTSVGNWAFNNMNITISSDFKGTDAEKAAVNAYITAKSNAGAPKVTTLTILNSGITYGEGAISSAINVRASANGAYTDEAIEDMSIAEAVTRVNIKSDALVNTMYTDDASVKAEIVSAFGGYGSLTADWKADGWTVENGITTNTIVLAEGDMTEEIAIVMKGKTSFYSDGASILTSDAFTANNNKQGLRFYNSFESTAADKILVGGKEYAVTGFGVLLKQVGVDASTVKANKLNDSEMVIGASGVTVIEGKTGTVQTEDGKNFYTVYIKNVPQGGRAYSFQCRGYIKYLDENDAEQIIYTDSQIKSVQDVFDANSTADEYVGMSDWFAGK